MMNLVNIKGENKMTDAQKEYYRQSDIIRTNLNILNESWAKIQRNYKKQLEKDPNSWAGIGRGSELGDMVVKSSELAEFFERMK